MSNNSSKNIKRLSVPQSPVVLAILDGWGDRKENLDDVFSFINYVQENKKDCNTY